MRRDERRARRCSDPSSRSEVSAHAVAYFYREPPRKDVVSNLTGFWNDFIAIRKLCPERLRNERRDRLRIGFAQGLCKFGASKPLGHFRLLRTALPNHRDPFIRIGCMVRREFAIVVQFISQLNQ